MINTYDVKDSIRETDKIWNSYNKLSVGKQTGGLGKTEFSDHLINIGEVFANLIRQGKVNNETIESYKTHLSQFTGENKDNYFIFPHEGLERVPKASYESIDFAYDAVEKRNMYAPSMTQEERESYTLGFRKLG